MTMVKPVGDAKRTIDSRMLPTAIELLGEIATGSRKVGHAVCHQGACRRALANALLAGGTMRHPTQSWRPTVHP